MNALITTLTVTLAVAVSVGPAGAKESSKIRGSMDNTGVVLLANGKVVSSLKAAKSKLSVKVRGLETSTAHTLSVGGVVEASAVSNAGGGLRFTLRTDKGADLDFDPRGVLVELLQGATVVLSRDWPAG